MAAKKPSSLSKPQPVSKIRRRKANTLEPGSLNYYLFYASVLHILFFGLTAFKAHGKDLIDATPVDIMMDEQKTPPKEQPPPPPPPPEKEPQPVARNNMEQTPVAEPEQNDTVKAIGALGERGDANFQAPVVKTIKPETVKPPPPVQKPVSMTTMMKRAVMRSVSAAPDTATGARDTGPGLSLPSQALNGLGDNYGVKDQGVVTVYGGSAFRSVYNGKLTAKVYYIPP
ncbi:MAG TPA: hypothetical protein VGJ84_13215, partial [Polyangiaceae bacterium]